MCGFAGLLDVSRSTGADRLHDVAGAMADRLQHRGPDDRGTWSDESAGIALGHRRLAILDLSEHGHQPMRSAHGRYVIAYNGEVYNFPELRRTLEQAGHRFRGHSDTEVILAAFEEWGIERALTELVGMFALAVWDVARQALVLCRDRLGEKPLYYGWSGTTFLFGSELKAFHAFPGWDGAVDRDALALFIRHSNVPAPHSIYRGVHKLLPGMLLTLPAAAAPGTLPAPRAYWRLLDAVEAGRRDPFAGSDDDAIDALESLLKSAVRGQMIADVPLGAFLSGGIDSSTIVALMQAQSATPIRTFTIGFHEPGYNEAEHAKAIARHLGTAHTELYVTAVEAQALIPRLPQIYDEPFADNSQLPTLLIAELARRHVTVALSGDAGDELFGGYNRYIHGRRVWSSIGWAPLAVKRGISSLVHAVPPATWDRVGRMLPSRVRQPQLGDRIRKAAEVVASPDAPSVYTRLISHWPRPARLVPGAADHSVLPPYDLALLGSFPAWMMYADALTYLPDDILVKVDRAAMAHSLETRVPFLDHRVVEFAWRLPLDMRLRGGTGKWLLRQVLHRHVPRALVERPKQGFAVPLDHWLRGPLRDWAEALLDERRLRDEGHFDPGPVRERWREHLSGARNWQAALWCVLVFQSWLEHDRVMVPA